MNATLTLTKLDVLRVLRNGRYLIFAIAMPAALYLIIGNQKTIADGVDFKAYYMLSMATYGAFAGALMNNSIRIATERKSGWTRQLRLTSLPGWGYVFAKVVTSLVTTIPSVLVVFGIGAFLNHVEMPAWKWVANAVILWLVSMTFVSLAVAIGYRFDPETAQPAVMLTFFPMAILGGLWFPLGGHAGEDRQVVPDLPGAQAGDGHPDHRQGLRHLDRRGHGLGRGVRPAGGPVVPVGEGTVT